VAVALYLLGSDPVSVQANGATYLQRERGIEDVVFATLRYPDGRLAHFHVSWLDPHKMRRVTVVGSKKMLVFDDMAADEKLRIYDKGAAPMPGHVSYTEGVALRYGDIVTPAITMREPLTTECEHFRDCVLEGRTPRSDGRQGATVVRILEAAQRALREGGALFAL
jgi:predicted dehydrogenase